MRSAFRGAAPGDLDRALGPVDTGRVVAVGRHHQGKFTGTAPGVEDAAAYLIADIEKGLLRTANLPRRRTEIRGGELLCGGRME